MEKEKVMVLKIFCRPSSEDPDEVEREYWSRLGKAGESPVVYGADQPMSLMNPDLEVMCFLCLRKFGEIVFCELEVFFHELFLFRFLFDFLGNEKFLM